jgi:hypothetical protein
MDPQEGYQPGQPGQENKNKEEQNTYGGTALSPSKVGGNALAAKVGGKKSKRKTRRTGGSAAKSVGGRRRSGRRGRKSRRSRK